MEAGNGVSAAFDRSEDEEFLCLIQVGLCSKQAPLSADY